jgi:hypothetical protein
VSEVLLGLSLAEGLVVALLSFWLWRVSSQKADLTVDLASVRLDREHYMLAAAALRMQLVKRNKELREVRDKLTEVDPAAVFDSMFSGAGTDSPLE